MDAITKLFSEETFHEAEKRHQKTVDESSLRHKALTSLVSKVEGCAHVTQVAGRYLVHDGDVKELHQTDFTDQVNFFLFLGLTLTRTIGLPPHAPVAHKSADKR